MLLARAMCSIGFRFWNASKLEGGTSRSGKAGVLCIELYGLDIFVGFGTEDCRLFVCIRLRLHCRPEKRSIGTSTMPQVQPLYSRSFCHSLIGGLRQVLSFLGQNLAVRLNSLPNIAESFFGGIASAEAARQIRYGDAEGAFLRAASIAIVNFTWLFTPTWYVLPVSANLRLS